MPGTYGLTNSTTRSISVANTRPTAAFSVSPEVGDNSTYFEFDASGSRDAECPSSNLQVRWDWENDGIWDTAWLMCWQVVTHTYSAPGTYTAELEVREQWPSLTDTTTRQVTVEGPEPVYLPLVLRGDTD